MEISKLKFSNFEKKDELIKVNKELNVTAFNALS